VIVDVKDAPNLLIPEKRIVLSLCLLFSVALQSDGAFHNRFRISSGNNFEFDKSPLADPEKTMRKRGFG
jgi:hypothetical protein